METTPFVFQRFPKHVSFVEGSCLLVPSTCVLCSFWCLQCFLCSPSDGAIFEMLHCLQKGMSSAASIALQMWHHHITSYNNIIEHHITSTWQNQGAIARVKKNQHPSRSCALGSFWAFCYCRIALPAHVQHRYIMCSVKWFCLIWDFCEVWEFGCCMQFDEFGLCWCSPAYARYARTWEHVSNTI